MRVFRYLGCAVLIVGLSLATLGCGTSSNATSNNLDARPEQANNPQESSSNIESDSNQSESVKVKLKGIRQNSNGSLEIVKDGLTLISTPPTEGPQEVVWRYFKLLNEQKYEDAAALLQGFIYRSLHDEPGQKYLREIIAAQFVRMADITEIAPIENETTNAFNRRVYYIEVNLKLRGVVPPSDTDFRNGLNHFAVHVIQENEDSPWKIVILGGSPELEK